MPQKCLASATKFSTKLQIQNTESIMAELKSTMEEHMELMADLVQKLSSELRSGLRPAYENFMGFFHAIDWKEPWLMGLGAFHVVLLLVVILSRKNTNFQMCLFLLTCKSHFLYILWNDF
ncbi:PREDICTED: uncharacterized protein LOC109352750 [Lupinus angustifolius]|uniref:uncharacterized protein LOC109352750 n=1 Tax=Lupinus angustifolius TaxID=3871 RepID=UPI00092F5B77|nr:PREDICTED: uncharacterized protein LOC109352750 [Lupinus angustifolius]